MAKQNVIKEIALLKAKLEAKRRGPQLAIRVIDEDPTEAVERLVAAGAQRDQILVIERVMVDPPDRPEEEPPALTTPPSPRTVQATRMADSEFNRRRIEYPRDGSVA
jgi:hypothetical protein